MIARPQFERLWGDSSDEQRAQALELIETLNRDGLHNWMTNHPSLELEEYPIQKLREMAYKIQLKNYSRLKKVELIRGIQRYELQQSTHA